MPTLYVTEPGSVIRKRAGSLIVTVEKDDGSPGDAARRETLIEVEPHRLELVALVGRVNMTTDATHLCLKNGIAVSWFTRGGDFVGRLVPELSRTADLRLAQFRAADRDEIALPIYQKFVAAKLENSAAVLSAIRSNRRREPVLGRTISELRSMAVSAQDMHDRQKLLGLEGDGTRRYFNGLKIGFDREIRFTGRARRPPPDPANALLSFCYVLLANSMASILEARGFDPYLGFLHTVRSGRPSLALDLIEEMRSAIADRFVLRLCNRRELTLDHFKQDPERGGMRLTREGLRKFFRAWETFMDAPLPGTSGDVSADAAMHLQADMLAAHLRGKEAYEPLLLRKT